MKYKKNKIFLFFMFYKKVWKNFKLICNKCELILIHINFNTKI